LAAAAAVLDFGDRGAKMPPGEKVAKANSFFDLVDLTTFHLWSIPDRTPGETFQLTLQANRRRQVVDRGTGKR
jgi:hypothetical protein